MNTDVAAIREVLERYALSVNAGDFDTWLSLWADDGTAMPPDASVCVGKEQIRKAMEPEFNDLSLDMEIQSIEDAQVFVT